MFVMLAAQQWPQVVLQQKGQAATPRGGLPSGSALAVLRSGILPQAQAQGPPLRHTQLTASVKGHSDWGAASIHPAVALNNMVLWVGG